MRILVTGGAGYLGSVLCPLLIGEGHDVRVIDSLMYGGRPLQSVAGHPRFELIADDIRDGRALGRATERVDAVVHLAAIVGDPACALSPAVARAVNHQASTMLVSAARAAGVRRFVFASTCSNYGRMADTSALATEEHDLRPLSLYAETKVAVERLLLDRSVSPMAGTVLRFATLYGLSPRMRFDLTVNEFVREMLVRRTLLVYGERFWRPYVHVRDAARAIMAALGAPASVVEGRVFNVGDSDENYRKLDVVEIIRRRVPDGHVEFVPVAEDPRDYKVSFERIRSTLGYRITSRVADGVEEIAGAIEGGVFDRFDDPAYVNVPPKGGEPAQTGTESTCAP